MALVVVVVGGVLVVIVVVVIVVGGLVLVVVVVDVVELVLQDASSMAPKIKKLKHNQITFFTFHLNFN